MSPPAQCPYLALRYFEEGDSYLFYGRDEHVRELLSKLELNRFVAVLGSSGCGKSSLVRAGLLPELRSGMIPSAGHHWKLIEFKPGSSPMEELGRAFELGLGITHAADTIAEGPLGIARAVDSASLESSTNVLIIADQFEEIFSYIQDEEVAGRGAEAREQAQALVRRLLDAASEPNLRIYVVPVMRSDYLGDCAQFPDLPERMNAALYLVPRLRRDQLQRAIEAPVGRDIEPAVVQRLLGEAGTDPDQLPRLQHLLSRMWIAAGGGRITLEHYAAVGGWKNALEQHLEQIYESLSPPQQKACRLILQRISEIDRGRAVRRWATRQQLTALCGAEAEEVVERFHREGFLRLSGLNQDTVDVMHESVLRGWPRLAGPASWMEEENGAERRLRELVATAQEAGWQLGMKEAEKKAAPGISGLTLRNLVTWRNEFHPTNSWASRYADGSEFDAAMGFLGWCEDLQNELASRTRSRTRALIATLALLAIVFLCATIGFYWLTKRADLQAKQAEIERRNAQESTNRANEEKTRADGAAIAANREKVKADEEAKEQLVSAREAKSRELVAGSLEEREIDPEEGILLAMQAVNVAMAYDLPSTPAATTALHSTILASHVRATLRSHQSSVESVAYSTDGKHLATASFDQTVIIWNTATGKELVRLQGHEGPVHSVAFSPDGRRLATASDDATAKIWDVTTGKQLMTLSGHESSVNSVAFSPDGRLVATASTDATAKIWDASTSKELMTLRGHEGPVECVAFSPDGRRLATASDDKAAKIWDAEKGDMLMTLSGHVAAIRSVAFSPDGKIVATAGDDIAVRLWDSANGRELRRIRAHGLFVRSVAFSSDGRRLVTGSWDGTAKIFDAATGEEQATLRGHQYGVSSATFNPDGTQVATGALDHTAKIWDTNSNKELMTLRGHTNTVRAVTFNPDGNRMATASDDKTAMIWDAQIGKELTTLRGHEGRVNSVAFSPDGRRLATASDDATAKIWDAQTGKELTTLRGHEGPVHSVAFSPDGRRLATASEDATAKIWDAQTGKELTTLRGHEGRVNSVAFSPDGRRLATASEDATAKIWDAQTGKELTTLSVHTGAVECVAFSPDGRRLATGSDDNTAKIWDALTGKALMTLRGHENVVSSVAFNPDGRSLATASWDKTAKIWDAADGRELTTLRGHQNLADCVAFSPEGKRLATASYDHTVQVYAADLRDLLTLARSRVTRDLTPKDCQQYFDSITCPKLP